MPRDLLKAVLFHDDCFCVASDLCSMIAYFITKCLPYERKVGSRVDCCLIDKLSRTPVDELEYAHQLAVSWHCQAGGVGIISTS